MIEIETNVGYRDELTFDQAIQLEPGTLLEAQEKSTCMVVRAPGFNNGNCLVLFTPNPSVIIDAESGYVRFKVLNPARLCFVERRDA